MRASCIPRFIIADRVILALSEVDGEWIAGIINGTQAAMVAHKVNGKTEGVIGVGNGNPGATSIDKRQNGSEQGILDYNKENSTNFTVDKFADDEFFNPDSSIQKWSAKFDQYGDKLVGMIGVGNPVPLVKAAQGHNIEKGKIANLLVTKGDLFQTSTEVKYVLVDGVKYEPVAEAQATAGEATR